MGIKQLQGDARRLRPRRPDRGGRGHRPRLRRGGEGAGPAQRDRLLQGGHHLRRRHERVEARAAISRQGTTSIIHGKAWHEETKATVSQAISENGGTHYLVVFTLDGDRLRLRLHPQGREQGGVPEEIRGRLLARFRSRPAPDSVGVANQTTMMKGETEEVQRRFEKAMVDRYGRPEKLDHAFPQGRYDLRRHAGAAGCAFRNARRGKDEPAAGRRRIQQRATRRTWRRWARRSCRPTSSRIPTS